MRNAIPIKPEAMPIKNLAFLNRLKKKTDQQQVWSLHHLKTLRTSGRGGKGHFVGGINQGWNRKGRW